MSLLSSADTISCVVLLFIIKCTIHISNAQKSFVNEIAESDNADRSYEEYERESRSMFDSRHRKIRFHKDKHDSGIIIKDPYQKHKENNQQRYEGTDNKEYDKHYRKDKYQRERPYGSKNQYRNRYNKNEQNRDSHEFIKEYNKNYRSLSNNFERKAEEKSAKQNALSDKNAKEEFLMSDEKMEKYNIEHYQNRIQDDTDSEWREIVKREREEIKRQKELREREQIEMKYVEDSRVVEHKSKYVNEYEKLRKEPFGRKYEKSFRHKRPQETNHQTMKDLVFDLYSKGHITSNKVYDAMINVDRKYYLMHTNDSFYPYKDQIQYIPFGVVINAPHEYARTLEILKNYLKPGAKVLDIGSGSGYLTACFAHMVGSTGEVTAVELIPEVLQFTQYNIQQGNPNLLNNIKFELSDGRASYGQNGPYDVIHVGAAFDRYPEIFLIHLKYGGRLLIPIGETRYQMLNIYDKYANETIVKRTWGLVQLQGLKSISQQLRLMEVTKGPPMSVALKYYVRKMIDDRMADASHHETTQPIKRLRGGKKGKGRNQNQMRRKRKKFYNLDFGQRKHNMDQAEN